MRHLKAYGLALADVLLIFFVVMVIESIIAGKITPPAKDSVIFVMDFSLLVDRYRKDPLK